MRVQGRNIVAIENNVNSEPLARTGFSDKTVLVFGSENSGISSDLLGLADQVIHIEQLGSTRSLNVGVAAGIAMYEWLRQESERIDA